MNVNELLNYLAEQEVKLWVEGDRLRYRARATVINSDLRQELVEHKADLIRLLRSRNGVLSPERSLVGPVARTKDGIPLSFAQQGLWFLDQLAPQNSFYNVPMAWLLTDPLHLHILERSIQELVQRHESLRTTFVVSDGQPQQAIRPLSALPEHFLTVVDLTSLCASEREAISYELARQEAHRPFDLSYDLLLRTSILRLEEQKHVLLMTLHHIACDDWSGGILKRELGRLYTAFVQRKPSPLPALPIQYADFACWQRDRLQGALLEQLLAYWREQLDDLPTLNLPADVAHPAARTFRGAHLTQQLPVSLLARLKPLSQQEGVTLFMALLAAFQVLLMRYCNQEDVVVGVPVAGRNQEELMGVVGFFVNSVVLRTDLSGNPGFREVLRRVRDVTLDAYAHQDLPFERLVEALQPERQLASHPLYQVLFQLQQTSGETLPLPMLSASPFGGEHDAERFGLGIDNQTAKFDLSLHCFEEEGTLHCLWEYSTDVFDKATIARMMTHWQNLLEGIVVDPDQQIACLPLLCPEERAQLITHWNTTRVDYQELLIHQCFEKQVESTPTAPALIFEGTQLTYAELNQRANQLAHYLQRLGVGPDVLVGICMERSLSLLIGLLGILKAGGAYVPLDPAYPQERLRSLLEDSQVRVLLTQRQWLKQITAPQVNCLYLDEIRPQLAQESSANPGVLLHEDHLAYMIYTSGSTGKPKGTMNTQRGMRNRLLWMQNAYKLTASDAVLQKTPFSFDVSVWEFFWPLITGARLVIARPGGHQDSSYLVDIIQEQQISVVHFVPSMLSVFLQEREVDRCRSLRQVICSGEALSLELQERFFARLSAISLHNLYGPTEASIDVTFWECERDNHQATTVPIGRPIANTQIYLLDRHGQPVPVGTPAELLIGGISLARGYLNRVDLTAERFIPDPFSQEPGARLYRTGDLARYRRDGAIEYLGRLDNQVKLRGFRIELGEIEAVLAQHPSVQQSVVLLREDHAGDKQLVAYVAAHRDHAFTPGQLRSYVQDVLPYYMVPGAFIILPVLPLTSHGKLDYRALPMPGTMPQEGRQTYIAPQTQLEEIIAAIWEQVLHIEQVSTSENFFALGGHSLLATQVIARIQATLQLILPLRVLFEHPTIAALAHSIETMQQGTLSRPALTARSQQTLPPLSFAQQRLWFLDQLAPHNPFYNMSLALHLEGPMHITALERSLRELVLRHESLRTTFVMHEDQPAQAILPLVELPDHVLRLVDVQALVPSEQEAVSKHLAMQEAVQPFHLNSDLMMRAHVLRLDKQKHVLLLTLHHIACDGWSIGVLSRELSTLYQAFAAGDPSPLAPLPIQYADFACWQRDWLRGEVYNQQLAYWQEQLADLPTLNLPTDFARPQMETFRGGYVAQQLSPALLAQLKRLSQQEGVTLFMLLLAAFQLLLMRYSGQEDIVVGAPTANRTQQELEGLIGFFVNTLVLRTDLSGNPTFRELLARVREVTLGAYTHEDMPFERLVEALQPERNLAHNPLCQVAFQLQNTPQQPLTLAGLTITQRWANNQTAKLDLALFCIEEQEHLTCYWEYSTDLFTAATIERMSLHFQCVLTALLDNPTQCVQQINLLTSAERQQMLVEWNPPPQFPSPQDSLIQHFEAQAQLRPDAIALVCEQEHLTYGVLNRRANQLAHYLRELGVGPEALVGVALERSPDLIIALLSIFKVGGVYLPLDPAYPRQRLAFILRDAQLSFLLTHTTLQERFSSEEKRMLQLDKDWPRIAQAPDTNVRSCVLPHHLAYIIYTSGSTGLPKGVMVPHQGLYNLIQTQQSMFPVGPDSHVMQFASSSFDASLWEIMVALFWGARLCLVPHLSLVSGSSLEQVLQMYAIAIAAFPPSTLATLDPAQLPELHTVLSFGEECSESLALRWSQGRAFFNGYGPTETTICATVTRPYARAEKLTIGKPIPNKQVYILDQQLHLVPVGVPGELHIGGVSLARGYLRRPELTAQRFIAHPFSSEPGARLYKTGDLARYRPDGSIEFLGRVDEQVKLRGFRIELGEIEAVLTQHPFVQDAVVTMRQEHEDKQLVAYVVPATRAWETEEEMTKLTRQEQQEREQVTRWQELYAQSYQSLEPGSDPTFNIHGWNSSYTGQPIPPQEMRAWLEDTLRCIRPLRPRRVLEIGCGTGLLLFPLAPDCIHYDASDFSASSLGYVQQVIEQGPARYSSVRLWQRMADDFQGWEPESYDMVILNSVVQYFPDVTYLLRVLQGTLALLAPGGTLFVGDVRSLPMQEHFHLAVQLVQGSEGLSRQQVRQQVLRGKQLEEELLVDPALFVALGQQEERVEQVHILPKRSAAHNELSQFRYQALLQMRGREATPEIGSLQVSPWQEWQASYGSLEQLRETLRREQPVVLGVSRIPNALLWQVLEAHRWLWQEEEPTARTLGAVRQQLEGRKRSGVNLPEMDAMCTELGYQMQVSWAQQAEDGCYDVVLLHTEKAAGIDLREITASFPRPTVQAGDPWQVYTNRPLDGQRMRQLVPLLRQHMQERLPDYMVPAYVLVLERLPRTPNGKVDRRALPIPEGEVRLGLKAAYIAPRTPVEQKMAEIWMHVLGLPKVGVHDDFFALGGHSLLATQVIARTQSLWQISLPLRTLFECPTVESLSRALVNYELVPNQIETIARLYTEIDRMSPEEIKAVLGQTM